MPRGDDATVCNPIEEKQWRTCGPHSGSRKHTEFEQSHRKHHGVWGHTAACPERLFPLIVAINVTGRPRGQCGARGARLRASEAKPTSPIPEVGKEWVFQYDAGLSAGLNTCRDAMLGCTPRSYSRAAAPQGQCTAPGGYARRAGS